MSDQDPQDPNPAAASPEPSPAAAAVVNKPAPQPRPALAPRRSSGWAASVFMALIVLALVAAAGVWGWQRIDAQLHGQQLALGQMQAQVTADAAKLDHAQNQTADQAAAAQRLGAELTRFGDRLDAQDAAIGALRQELSGGRLRAQLVVVEQLLMLASERLQISREIPSAIAALEAADARLAALGDPRLFSVREAIGRERAALQAVPRVDDTGPALALSSLIERVPRMALKAQAPGQFEPTPVQPQTDVAQQPWQRAWNVVRQMVASSFVIRREQGPPTQLLTDAQTDLIRQVLALKLEGARVALLRRDAALFREQSRAASQWVAEYFNLQDPGIVAVNAELSRLQGLQLQPPLPDVSQSLVLLRTHLEASSQ